MVVFPALADPCSKHLALGDLATLPLLSRLLPPRGTHMPQVEPQPRPQAMLESSTMLEDIFKLPESMLGSSMLGSALPPVVQDASADSRLHRPCAQCR